MNKLICLFLVLGLSSVAFGLGPEITGVSVVDESTPYSAGQDATVMINGDGLNPDDSHSAGWPGMHWLSIPGTGSDDVYAVLDLGATYLLGDVRIWNYNENFGLSSVTDMDILVSADNVTYNPGISIVGLVQGPGVDTYDYSETFAMGGVSARYVYLDVVDAVDPSYAGLSEIRFYEVPEPATIALLGLGALALIRKRRTQ